MEKRQAQLETKAPMKLEGYALVFNSPARIGDYEEIISRSALQETDLSDVALIYNHSLNVLPLARTPKTLKLTVDNHGLKFVAELPNTEAGREVYEAVKRGDIRGCSFSFAVSNDFWQNGIRQITAISKIFEVSICPFPAYCETSVTTRNLKGLTTMFNTVAEAFNFYNQKSVAEIERRAIEIEQELSQGGDAKALNIELDGLREARANIDQSTELLTHAKSKIAQIITGFDADGGGNVQSEEVTSTAEYRSAFFKTLQGKNLSLPEKRAWQAAKSQLERRAAEYSTSTNSAAILPSATLDEIISKARSQGGLMAQARAFAVPSKIAIPVATPTEKAAWHVEGAAVDSAKVTPTTVTFDGNEILKIFSISAKVQTMSISAFESYLTQELEACVLETISDSLVNGTGSGQGTGILTAFDSDNTITTSGATISFADLVSAVSKLKRGYSAGAKWAMSNATLWNYIYRQVDTTQRPLFVTDLQNGAANKLCGYDIVVDDYLPYGTVIFGNFNYLAYNLPSGIVIETSRESSFKSGLIDFRAMAIADCKPIVNEAFVKIIPGQA